MKAWKGPQKSSAQPITQSRPQQIRLLTVIASIISKYKEKLLQCEGGQTLEEAQRDCEISILGDVQTWKGHTWPLEQPHLCTHGLELGVKPESPRALFQPK